MIMNNQDPDVVRWGLHLLQDEFSSNAYCGTTTQTDANRYEAVYISECNVVIDRTSVENDEVIAHVLQEELSQLALAEASGKSPEGEERLQASVLAQDWFGSPVNNIISDVENEDGHEAVNDMEHSNSCSSPGENVGDSERWSLELTDDFSSLDGEVGKRLNNMVSIPFRALSDQFYRTTEHHKFVRQQIVNQLMAHPEMYEGYVPMGYGEYLEKMSKNGEWGDHVTLQAAADSYGVKIFVLTSFKDTCYIEIMPSDQKSERVIFLSFWAEVHYNSIYPEGEELPAPENKKKKRWWPFGHKH